MIVNDSSKFLALPRDYFNLALFQKSSDTSEKNNVNKNIYDIKTQIMFNSNNNDRDKCI